MWPSSMKGMLGPYTQSLRLEYGKTQKTDEAHGASAANFMSNPRLLYAALIRTCPAFFDGVPDDCPAFQNYSPKAGMASFQEVFMTQL